MGTLWKLFFSENTGGGQVKPKIKSKYRKNMADLRGERECGRREGREVLMQTCFLNLQNTSNTRKPGVVDGQGLRP